MTTTTRPYITPHAFRRWHERFGGNIMPALDRAVPFGGQLGTESQMLIDKITGAVFVISHTTGRPW